MKWIPFGTVVLVAALLVAGHAGSAPAPVKPKPSGDLVVMDTSLGKIKIRLYPKKAPLSVANFLDYVDRRFYDNTVYHRVIPNFMIQGGGLDTTLALKKAGKPIKNESDNGLSNKRGTIACARAAAADSATCQFYINHKDNALLDRKSADQVGYCVFGEVIEGMEVVDKIARVKTGDRGLHQNVPIENVVIRSVRRVGK